MSSRRLAPSSVAGAANAFPDSCLPLAFKGHLDQRTAAALSSFHPHPQQQQQQQHESPDSRTHLPSQEAAAHQLKLLTDSDAEGVHHPVFAVSPSSGITYSWISPPKSLPRKRTVFSRHQRTSLESRFQSQKYISKSERMRFARELGLKDSQVSPSSPLMFPD